MGDVRRCASCTAEIPADAPAGACPRCALAAALPPPSGEPTPEDVAAKLPAFDILGVLGRGGMGVVFKARQKALDRVVALKVLPPATAKAPGFAERFVREAKAMARLQHPNIVAVHDFGAGDGLSWLSMEFVDGMNMREAMARGRVTPKEALAIVPQICDALQYAHDRGVVHRDIKPENVLIDRDGRVRIADFGLAKLADRDSGDPSLTGVSQVMGTLHYMAPEQWERPKDVDHRCDIYSLGVVFYEMLTGELPVGRFEPPSKRAEIDVRVDEVVMRSLERNREQRWQRADEVKTKVTAITSSSRVAAPPPPTGHVGPDDRRPVRRIGNVVVAVPFIAGFGLLIAAMSMNDPRLVDPGFWWATVACFVAGIALGIVRYERKGQPRAVAAPPPAEVPRAPAAEPADLWQRSADAMSWWPALLPMFATMILGAVGFDTGIAWWDRMALLMAKVWVVSFFVLHMARDAKVGAALAKSGVGRVLAALVPARISLAPHSSLLVLASAASAVAGFVVTRLGDTAGALIGLPGVFLVLVVLWMCERRSKAVRAAAAGTRGPVGSPMAIELVAMVTLIAGVVALGWARLDHGAAADGTKAAAVSVRYVGASSEFEIVLPEGEDRAHKPWDTDPQGIASMWAKAQALQGGIWSSSLAELYPLDDSSVLQWMSDARRAEAVAQRAIGPLFLPKSDVDLRTFRIERVRLGGWSSSGRFTTATVEATDGARTLRFSMRVGRQHKDWDETWLFAIAPLELR